VDYCHTRYVVGDLGGQELNPMMDHLIRHHGWRTTLVFKMVGCLIFLASTLTLYRWSRRGSMTVLVTVLLLYLTLVLYQSVMFIL